MSKKQPGFYLYTGDWKKDPAVTACSPATRGIWLDLLCAMHDGDSGGTLSGTMEQLARIGRCSPAELAAALDELSTTGAAEVAYPSVTGNADVRPCNGIVTVTNRRMAREAKTRELTRNRVKKHRERANGEPVTQDVTPEYMPSSLSLSPSTSSSDTTTTTTHARSVTSGVTECVTWWNRFVPREQQCPPEGTPDIDRTYSNLVNASPPLAQDEILGAIENYRLALALPNSQAHPHTLGMFLRREIIRKYLPGTFNIANYDRSRFQNGRNRDGPPDESPEEIQARLKAKGIL